MPRQIIRVPHPSGYNTATATSAGPTSAGSGDQDDNSGGEAWSNVGNVTASDDTYATCALFPLTSSDFLIGDNFGFAIPGGATITGIEMAVERKTSVSGVGGDSHVQLLKAGVQHGDNKSGGHSWPTVEAERSWGGASDMWGGTWTPSDINDANFGLRIAATGDEVASCTLSVDHIKCTIYYTV
tara:strand:+ start:463 stop:1014 length:552 start_codon:yes stop_codon:yes gene_type:complete